MIHQEHRRRSIKAVLRDYEAFHRCMIAFIAATPDADLVVACRFKWRGPTWTLSLAAEMSTAVDATLTLVHITTGVEVWGPGGSSVESVWKEMIVGNGVKEIARLQQDVGTKADVIIDSGNVPNLSSTAAEQTNTDLLVVGHSPEPNHPGENGEGYGIIRESRIPVLSV